VERRRIWQVDVLDLDVESFIHASIRSSLRIVRPQSVANLDQVTIRVSEVDRKELSRCAFALVWTSEDVDTQSASFSLRPTIF
jgi:hypothetical protein